MNSARSLAEMRGSLRDAIGLKAMDEILASTVLADGRSVHIATLARETILANAADHLGFGGYFVFETTDAPSECGRGINILAKALSLDAAFRIIDIWSVRPQAA